MVIIETLRNSLLAQDAVKTWQALYGQKNQELARQAERYRALIDKFVEVFPDQPRADLFCAPGRTEIGGNHTDHNHGQVLAAAVNLDVIAAAAPNNMGIIHLYSDGYPASHIDLSRLDAVDVEKNTSGALIRGVCARLQALGFKIGGFDACANSDVLKGSGLSSSASFEILVVTILNTFYNAGQINAMTAALVGQFAENVYFGKPCGLMDQTASAVGGFVTIDFAAPEAPVVKKVDFDFVGSGYALVIVDTGGNHADLTEEYASVAADMRSVAQALGGRFLRDVAEGLFFESLPKLRGKVTDRALLRAIHFYNDHNRVGEQVRALQNGDFPLFLELVNASGVSSWTLNQNVFTCKNPQEQGVSLALAASERILKGRGAWRVHGGGFAGTIQAFVPFDLLDAYLAVQRAIFGAGACHELSIRSNGAGHITF